MMLRNTWAPLIAIFFAVPLAAAAQAAPGEGFLEAAPTTIMADSQAATGAADGMVFAEGTRAINEGRWADAVKIFSKIAEQKSDHADGALYWRAYAENKLGKSADALAACSALRASYPKSSWLDDCGALEIEIGTRTGKPVQPDAERSDDLRLLALNSLMQHDEEGARAMVEDILNDEDASGRLKEGALFILGKSNSHLTLPEIARVSYVEGDVRIARGKENEKTTGDTWEKAAGDLSLESGFSLVTGAGRAEIELEDASTLYLGENSVLVFNLLETTDGVPDTDIALLSGTVTLHVKPYLPDETFILRTPSDDNLIAHYPTTSYARVTSYVDATAYTVLDSGVLNAPGLPAQSAAGQTLFYRGSHRTDPPEGYVAVRYAPWDEWVANRVARRTASMNAMMKAAGLTSPLPGLAEMEGQGKFFNCSPYGTCWEPNAAVPLDTQADNRDAQGSTSTSKFRAPSFPRLVRKGWEPSLTPATFDRNSSQPRLVRAAWAPAPAQQSSAASPSPLQYLERDEFFPCAPQATRFQVVRDAAGRAQVIRTSWDTSTLPYEWGVCHSGYWIHHHHHYCWVVGKRHHHEPIRWVKAGRTIAFVPIHPRDVTGKTPINAKNDVFAVSRHNGGISIEHIALGADHPIELLNAPPREFRTAYLAPLPRAEEPRMESHALKDAFGNRELLARTAIPISFEHKSQSFTMPMHVMQGNKMVTIASSISNHGGNLSAATHGAGSFSGSHGGAGSSGSHGGSAGGGGGFSGGGGSHGGGSVSSASSGGSSSSGSSGGGGSHH
jgi:FecR protein